MRSNRYYAAAVIWNRKEKTRALIEDREPELRPENPEEEREMRYQARKRANNLMGSFHVEPWDGQSDKKDSIRDGLMDERQGNLGKGGKRKWGFKREI